MKLSEFIAKIGDENISFQLLNQCLTNIKTSKKDKNLVTFATEGLTPNDVMANTGNVGMIVWVPRERYEEIARELVEPNENT